MPENAGSFEAKGAGLMENVLYLVIPCYNEEEVLPETAARIKEKMNDLIGRNKVAQESRFIYRMILMPLMRWLISI